MLGFYPHPKHIGIALLYIAVGYFCLFKYQWEVFGLIAIGIGLMTAVVIGWRITLEGYKEYWEQINRFIELTDGIKNPDVRNSLMEFFGFKGYIKSVTVKEVDTSAGEAYPQVNFRELPVQPHVMQYIADCVLTGKSFSETELAGKGRPISGRKFRAIQDLFEKNGYAVQSNRNIDNSPRLITHKGKKALFEWASMTVKQQLKETGGG